jgi:TonB family protein
VVTGVLAGKNPDTATLNKPAREVQTGGFGDPNGARGEGRPDRAATIARLGSFGLPAGPGNGNGSGGARGSQGVVASAGFGNAIGSGGSSARAGSNATIQQGSFGDARPDQTGPSRAAKPAEPVETPAEVTFKPRPEYTEEARKARDEGEVLVRVLFAANGNVRVLEVVKGLPHGLDQNALRAAEQIRFKPATKDGKPVDSVAIVHINFQLAY